MSRVKPGIPVVVSLPPKGASHQTGKRYLSIGRLIEGAQKLRVVAQRIGLQSFNELIRLAGAEKGYEIIHRFVQYHDDFASAAELFLFFFASQRFLMKNDGRGKLVEVYPVRVDSPASQIERHKYLKAVRGMAGAFGKLDLSAEEARSLVEQAGPFVFPPFAKVPFNAMNMLSDLFVGKLVGRYGLEKFIEALRTAYKNRPADLEAEVSRLIGQR